MTNPAQFESYESAARWGSSLEARVFFELIDRGYRHGVDFTYQAQLFGGRQEPGGYVPDFVFTNPPGLVISVLGAYWHLVRHQSAAAIVIFRAQLAAINLHVVFLTEQHIIEDVRFYVGEALRGVDYSGL